MTYAWDVPAAINAAMTATATAGGLKLEIATANVTKAMAGAHTVTLTAKSPAAVVVADKSTVVTFTIIDPCETNPVVTLAVPQNPTTGQTYTLHSGAKTMAASPFGKAVS